MKNTRNETPERSQPHVPAIISAFLCIAATVLFIFSQALASRAWADPAYSWIQQSIRDLGATTAPLHDLLDKSLIIQGFAVAIAVWAIRPLWRKSVLAIPSCTMMTLSGIGFVIAGLAPFDAYPSVHMIFGAAPILLFGVFGLIIAGFAVDNNYFERLWVYTFQLAVVGMVGGFLYFTENYLGTGQGLIERIWVFALLTWFLIIAGKTLHKELKLASKILRPRWNRFKLRMMVSMKKPSSSP